MTSTAGTYIAITLVAILATSNVRGENKVAYDRRAAAWHVDLFEWLDRDRNGAVTRIEADGNVDFTPVFDDMDIDRDGIVTRAELDRYLGLRYGTPGH